MTTPTPDVKALARADEAELAARSTEALNRTSNGQWLDRNEKLVAEALRHYAAALRAAPEVIDTIDSVPSCGQENDYGRASRKAPEASGASRDFSQVNIDENFYMTWPEASDAEPVAWRYLPVEPTPEILDALAEECRATWGINVEQPKRQPLNFKNEWRERMKPFYRALMLASPPLPTCGGRDRSQSTFVETAMKT
jgi:hypothetical protein